MLFLLDVSWLIASCEVDNIIKREMNKFMRCKWINLATNADL